MKECSRAVITPMLQKGSLLRFEICRKREFMVNMPLWRWLVRIFAGSSSSWAWGLTAALYKQYVLLQIDFYSFVPNRPRRKRIKRLVIHIFAPPQVPTRELLPSELHTRGQQILELPLPRSRSWWTGGGIVRPAILPEMGLSHTHCVANRALLRAVWHCIGLAACGKRCPACRPEDLRHERFVSTTSFVCFCHYDIELRHIRER